MSHPEIHPGIRPGYGILSLSPLREKNSPSEKIKAAWDASGYSGLWKHFPTIQGCVDCGRLSWQVPQEGIYYRIAAHGQPTWLIAYPNRSEIVYREPE